eukprot:6562565-Pyramimonas_sp.AAC.1
MIEWMRKISCEQPSRCSIIFGGDVNDHSGIPPPDKLRGYMEDFGLCLVNTYIGGQATSYGR